MHDVIYVALSALRTNVYDMLACTIYFLAK